MQRIANESCIRGRGPLRWVGLRPSPGFALRVTSGQSALAAASTSSAWPSTFTFSHTSATLPSGPIR